MPLVSTRSLFDDAAARHAGVGAFNVITLAHAEAIAAGAVQAGHAAIMQISHNAVRFRGALGPLAAATRAVAEASSARLALHLDHVEDEHLLHQAADAGFSSAMFDAGARPYEQNVAATRTALDWAHSAGVLLEAELGYVGGKPGAPASAHAPGVRTDPEEASRFVAETGVDALAVAVGSSHAMTTRTAVLDLDLIERLNAAVPTPLVLHGSSGVPDAQLAGAVSVGIVKVNVGTALNIAFTAAVRGALAEARSPDPRAYLAAGRAAMTETVAHLLGVLAR